MVPTLLKWIIWGGLPPLFLVQHPFSGITPPTLCPPQTSISLLINSVVVETCIDFRSSYAALSDLTSDFFPRPNFNPFLKSRTSSFLYKYFLMGASLLTPYIDFFQTILEKTKKS